MSLTSKKLELYNQTVFLKSSEDMSELEDESIDVIITSSPYNRRKIYSSDFSEKYDDAMEEGNYLSFLKNVWKECYRIAKKSALFFLNIGDSAIDQGKSEKVAITAEQASWKRIQDVIWLKTFLGKGHYTPTGGSKRLNNIWEHVFLFVKNKKEYRLNPKAIGIPYADKSNIGRYSDSDLRDAGNAWLINYKKTTGATVKKGHDAPFPIGLPCKCIKLAPNPQTVLDPFGGTCTTLAACLKLGVKGYAYEKYPRIEVIKSRILEGKTFNEDNSSLIPHLELSTRVLSDLLSELNYNFRNIKSKKEFLNSKILLDVLCDLKVKNSFKSSLEKRINNYNQRLSKKNQQERKYAQRTF